MHLHKFLSARPQSVDPAYASRDEWNDAHIAAFNVLLFFADYTILVSDIESGLMAVFNSSAAIRTATLPAASSTIVVPTQTISIAGLPIIVKRHGANNVVIGVTGGDTIYVPGTGAQSSYTLAADGDWALMIPDGVSSWELLI